MTPLAIQIMLNCYCSAEPWQNMHPRIWNSSAAQEARDMLVRDELLDADTLRPTGKGAAYVDAICEVRPCHLPAALLDEVEASRDPYGRGKILKSEDF